MVRRCLLETLQQQNPGGSDRLRIKAEYFPTFVPERQVRDLPIVLSIDPAQKAAPTSSFSVIQVWARKDGAHLLLDQCREQAPYSEFRSQAWLFIRKYRPSVVLIEDTGQGPALSSDITQVVPVTPIGDKVERLRAAASSPAAVSMSRCVNASGRSRSPFLHIQISPSASSYVWVRARTMAA